MFLKIIFFSLFILSSTFALQPPQCVVDGFSSKYVKKGNKTRVETLKMKITNDNNSDFIWNYFDFGSKGRLELSIGYDNRNFKLNFKEEDGKLKGFNLFKWVQSSIPRTKRAKASMYMRFWFSVHTYCTVHVDSLKNWH